MYVNLFCMSYLFAPVTKNNEIYIYPFDTRKPSRFDFFFIKGKANKSNKEHPFHRISRSWKPWTWRTMLFPTLNLITSIRYDFTLLKICWMCEHLFINELYSQVGTLSNLKVNVSHNQIVTLVYNSSRTTGRMDHGGEMDDFLVHFVFVWILLKVM